jgi:hypothetical protein
MMMSGILTHIVYLWETCCDDFRAKITQVIKRVLLACMNMNVETIRQRTKLKPIDGLVGAGLGGEGRGRGLTDELPDGDDLIIAILLEALKFRSPRLLKKLGTKVFETLNFRHENSSDSSKKPQRIGLPPSLHDKEPIKEDLWCDEVSLRTGPLRGNDEFIFITMS